MRKLIGLILSLAIFIILFGGNVDAAAESIEVHINSTPISFEDQEPILQNNRVLVPIRTIGEALGATFEWAPTTQKVTFVKGTDQIELILNKKTVYKNGSYFKELDVPAQSMNGRTMVPLRFIGESLGAKVVWDAKSNLINIEMQGVKIKSQEEKNAEIEVWLQNMSEGDKAKVLGELKALPYDFRYGNTKNFDEVNALSITKFNSGRFNSGRNLVPVINQTAFDYINTAFNYDYKTIDETFKNKELYFYKSRVKFLGEEMNPKDYLDKKIQLIKENQAIEKAYFITDSTMFHLKGHSVAVRGRMYYKIQNWKNNPYNAKLDTWYQEDIDVHLGIIATNLNIDWEHPIYTIDYIETIASMKPITTAR